MKYKIIKLLHRNFTNNIYLVKFNDNNYILKRYPLVNRKKDYKEELWREILLASYVNSLSKDKKVFFMNLQYKHILKCNDKFMDFSSEKVKTKKIKNCYDLIFDYKGITLNKLPLDKLSLKERYSCIIQIVYALDILRKGKFVHNDTHSGNITYKKINNVKVGNKVIKTKYKYALIDFGFSMHQLHRNELFKNYFYINWDLIYFINSNVLQLDSLRKLIKSRDYNIHTPYFKMEDIIELYKKYPKIWKKIKTTLTQKGKYYINWFDIFEAGEVSKFYHNFNDDFPTLRTSGNYKINQSIIEEIKILYSAYNRKKWLKHYHHKKYIPNLIPSKDIEFMILNLRNNKKVIKYFIEKLNL